MLFQPRKSRLCRLLTWRGLQLYYDGFGMSRSHRDSNASALTTSPKADHSFVYPQRLGPAGVSPSKNMRLRYLLANPRCMRGRHEFMQVLTARTDLGIEFVERFQLRRIAIAVLLPVALSTILGVLYSVLTGDVSSAFTISGKVRESVREPAVLSNYIQDT